MHTFLLTLHIILACLLVFVILMQPGKGADPSSAFGGGAASQLFGAAGPGNVLTRGTGAIATLFMITSITLAYQSTKANQAGGGFGGGFDDVLDDGAAGGGFGGPSEAPAPSPEGTGPSSDAPSPGTPPPAPGGDEVPVSTPDGSEAPAPTPAPPTPDAPAPSPSP